MSAPASLARRPVPAAPAQHTSIAVRLTPTELDAIADVHATLDAAVIERVVGRERRQSAMHAIAKFDNARRASRGRGTP